MLTFSSPLNKQFISTIYHEMGPFWKTQEQKTWPVSATFTINALFCTNTPHQLTLFTVDKVETKTTADSYCQVFTALNWTEFTLLQNTFFPNPRQIASSSATPHPPNTHTESSQEVTGRSLVVPLCSSSSRTLNCIIG